MMRVLTLFLYLFFLAAACSKDNRCGCFDSLGKTATEVRSLSAFNELEIDNVFDVTLHIDSNPRITIETGSHLFKGIQTKIENNRLYIKNLNTCNWIRKYNGHIKLDIYTTKINYLRLNESCNVNCSDTIITNEIKVDNFADIATFNLCVKCSTLIFAVHAGTGDFTLNGSSAVCHLWNSGYGNFHFSNLPTEYCYITSRSTGNCFITVNKEIEATLENAGNIYYSGNPYKISATQNSSGKLIKN